MKKITILIFILFLSDFTYAKESTWKIMLDESGLPFIKLKIGNTEQIALLDTGSPDPLTVPMKMIEKLGPKKEKKEKVKSTDITGNVEYSRQFFIEKLSINDILFKNLNIVEFKPWGLFFDQSSGEKNKNQFTQQENLIIGIGLFHDKNITLDIREGKLIISDEPPSNLDAGWLQFPFITTDRGHIVILMNDGYKDHKMVLDTGANFSAINAKSLAADTKIEKNEGDYLSYTQLSASQIPNTTVYSYILNDYPDDAPMDGMLGTPFMYDHLVRIDFKNKKIWVKKLPDI